MDEVEKKQTLPPSSRRDLLDDKLYLDLAQNLLPPYIVFDDAYELRFQSKAARRFLTFEDGAVTLDARRLMTRDARTLVTSAVERQRAGATADIVFCGVGLSPSDETQQLSGDLRVRCIPREGQEPWTAVFFHLSEPLRPTTELPAEAAVGAFQERIRILEAELESTRHRLRVTVAKFEASNEELQRTNQELQSVNQALHTVNAELQSKIQELSRVNTDMDEVLATVDTGILVLDEELRINRFNKRAANFIRIVEHDMGRPLSHLSHSFSGTPILDDCARAVRERTIIERLLFTDEGQRVLFRTKPIQSVGRNGVLISFSDVTSLQTLEDSAQRLNEAVDELEAPVVLLDTDGIVTYANRYFSRLARRDAAFLPGTAFADLLTSGSRAEFQQALEGTREGRPWRGIATLEVRGATEVAEEVWLRPLMSKTGQVIGAARFSAPVPNLGRDVRILLVEDNPGDAELVKEQLRSDGLLNHFEWVTSAEEALSVLQGRVPALMPDLVLVDLRLPRMSGDELVREMRARPSMAHLPVAILTGAEVDEHLPHIRTLGAVAVMGKPVTFERLRQVMRGLDGFWFSAVRYPSSPAATSMS